MTFLEKLDQAVTKHNSLLCVGLDSDIKKLPAKFKSSQTPQLDFNKTIIDATAEFVCSYKLNSAFYEGTGASGLEQLQHTVEYIRATHPEIPLVLDAKRADIGNTNDGYIDYIFDYLKMDAVTLNPYLGKEALAPFLGLKDKGLIILCRTSNEGAGEFQDLKIDGKPLYQHIAERVTQEWNTNNNCLLVVGANGADYSKEMKQIRQIAGDDIIFLVPGIGAQGGDVEQTVTAGVNSKGRGLIIHSARSIIFSDNPATEAKKLRDEINKYRGA